MKITSPELKKMILDVLSFTDEVRENGARERRITYKKDLIKGVRELKSKISECVFLFVGQNSQELSWIKANEYDRNMGLVSEEKFTDEPIELSNYAIDAFKYYYNIREEVLELSDEGILELDTLLK